MYKGRCYLMDITPKRRKELDDIVQDFCSKYGFDVKNDLFVELKKIGFEVYSAQFKRQLSGMILVNEKVDRINNFKSNKIIVYNKNCSYYQIRFVLLHELSHYIIEKFERGQDKLLFAVRDPNERYHDDVEEQEKDYMAAAMLVPTEEILMDIQEYKKTLDCNIIDNLMNLLTEDKYFIQMLQRKYKIEDDLAERRIKEVMESA